MPALAWKKSRNYRAAKLVNGQFSPSMRHIGSCLKSDELRTNPSGKVMEMRGKVPVSVTSIDRHFGLVGSAHDPVGRELDPELLA